MRATKKDSWPRTLAPHHRVGFSIPCCRVGSTPTAPNLTRKDGVHVDSALGGCYRTCRYANARGKPKELRWNRYGAHTAKW